MALSMSFDAATRKRLAGIVADCRDLLTAEFDSQLQENFGVYAAEGRILDIAKLPHLDDERLRTATLIRERISHITATDPSGGVSEAVKRVLREQAFTVLNRFVALRMAEERGLVVEAVGGGLNSKAFRTFSEVAFSGLGGAYERYREFLFCLFDELAVDLGILFDRASPLGLLFPRQDMLVQLFDVLNAADIKRLWSEDETIGWVYQYYNDAEERSAIRDPKRGGSTAPRNSRELAVRNQFFTPRYVVEFLTDNTLGRLWYEMTRGETTLRECCRYLVRRPTEIFLRSGESSPDDAKATEDLSQRELFQHPLHVPYRPLKDPREIRLLDPACGSMHFGLYAFDLFTVIYDEAWNLEEKLSADALVRAPEMKSLHATFPDKAAFIREVPRLIIEHNLHGIDIDPRAVQIAGLSLWLRAQRAWHQAAIKPADRPGITRSNLVCAERMPGEKELLREFVEQQFPSGERPAFNFLLETVFDRMNLAGEAGSLLRIEEEIRAAIAEAKQLWKDSPKHEEATLFTEASASPRNGEMHLDLSGITDGQFWERAEQRIYDALEAYAMQAEDGGGFQRRLFADDAAQGFAFIDLCRNRYDVVVMNPPFGNPTASSRAYLGEKYPKLWADIYAAFVERGLQLLIRSGRLGAITSRTFLALSSFETLRNLLIDVAPIQLLAECGLGVLDDATVRAAFFVSERSGDRSGAVIFWDLRRTANRSLALLDAIHDSDRPIRYLVLRQTLRNLPGRPFAYWLPERFLQLLARGPHLDPRRVKGAEQDRVADSAPAFTTPGVQTGDDARFVRCHWEVPPSTIGPNGWTRFAHASGFCRFYAPSYTVLNWGGDGREILAGVDKDGNIRARLRCSQYFLREGLVSPYISERGLGCSYLPRDHILSNSCRAFYDLRVSPNALVGYLNSSFVDIMVWALTPDRKHEAGIVASLPIPHDLRRNEGLLSTIARECWTRMFMLRSADECDPYHSPVTAGISTTLKAVANELRELQQRLDKAVAEIFGEGSARLAEIAETGGVPHDFGEWLQCPDEEDENTGDAQNRVSVETFFSTSQISFAAGCVYGRWDIRHATRAPTAVKLPDPCAPLPICPPATLQGDNGLPLTAEAGRRLRSDARYPLDVAWDGILVDDPDHPLDVERRIHAAIAVLWGDGADAVERDTCAVLGVATLREWFHRPSGFFADHLKRYSKSRRQAPVYWPLSTASGNYTLWIYYHRLSDQTLFQCVNEFVKPKLVTVESDLARISSAGATNGRQRAEIERLTNLRAELVELRDELLRIAQLPYKPNLNDGVLITACPLWNLFRLPKWQKDLKGCWDDLSKGKCDWAHLALSIWPDRVKKACKTDRSIAIAHGLESLCDIALAPTKRRRSSPKGQDGGVSLDLGANAE